LRQEGTVGRSAAIRLVLVTVVVSAVASVAAQAASAGGKLLFCNGETEKPFAIFDDNRSYRLVPGGDFEGSLAGWTLTGGARIVSGSETFNVRGPGSYSLYLPPGSSATSPSVCVGITDPTLRFFAVETGASSGRLQVDVMYRTLLGLLPLGGGLGNVTGEGAWMPTQSFYNLGSLLGSLQLDLTADVRFRFTPKGSLFAPASYRIDNVFVDPWFND
jgi:hypothetical protein